MHGHDVLTRLVLFCPFSAVLTDDPVLSTCLSTVYMGFVNLVTSLAPLQASLPPAALSEEFLYLSPVSGGQH